MKFESVYFFLFDYEWFLCLEYLYWLCNLFIGYIFFCGSIVFVFKYLFNGFKMYCNLYMLKRSYKWYFEIIENKEVFDWEKCLLKNKNKNVYWGY